MTGIRRLLAVKEGGAQTGERWGGKEICHRGTWATKPLENENQSFFFLSLPATVDTV
jgi:hypothetical protein